MRDADFGVRGGVVGVVSWSGGARCPSCRGGVEGADGVVSVMDRESLTFFATGTSGCVQW
jgi:hypothetical protein